MRAPVPWPRRVASGPATGLRIGRRAASADYAAGTNELPVQLAMVDLLGPGDAFLDIGANVGFFALLADRLVGDGGRVWAIEPVPANVAAARANVRRNGGRVEVIEAAAGAAPGRATLLLAAHPGGATIAAAAPPDPVGAVEVAVVAVDDLVARGVLDRAPDLVKIDVEGAEAAVLAGMAETMRRSRPAILCEVDAPDDDGLARRHDEVGGALAAAGYRVERLERSYATAGWRVDHLLARPGTGR